MVAEQERGGRPINRPRNYEESKRREEKWRKKTNWFKTGGFTTVLFCPWTPSGELAKRWREVEERGWCSAKILKEAAAAADDVAGAAAASIF